MNRFAYRMTGLAIKTIADLSKAHIHIHGAEHIPHGSLLFVINHFTRIETLLMPYQIFKLTDIPVWSLASAIVSWSTLSAESIARLDIEDFKLTASIHELVARTLGARIAYMNRRLFIEMK